MGVCVCVNDKAKETSKLLKIVLEKLRKMNKTYEDLKKILGILNSGTNKKFTINLERS